jgi:hypothetical protein
VPTKKLSVHAGYRHLLARWHVSQQFPYRQFTFTNFPSEKYLYIYKPYVFRANSAKMPTFLKNLVTMRVCGVDFVGSALARWHRHPKFQ